MDFIRAVSVPVGAVTANVNPVAPVSEIATNGPDAEFVIVTVVVPVATKLARASTAVVRAVPTVPALLPEAKGTEREVYPAITGAVPIASTFI